MIFFNQFRWFRTVPALIICVLCSPAFAEYSNMLWVGRTPSVAPKMIINGFEGNSLVSTVTINPPSGSIPMTVVDSDCVSYTGVGEEKSATQWIMSPNSGVNNGIKWSLVLNTGSIIAGPYKGSQLGASDNYSVVAFSQVTAPSEDIGCYSIGTQYQVRTDAKGSLTGTLTLNMENAIPGVYNFTIPLFWGIEENKYTGKDFGILIRKRIGASLVKAGGYTTPISFTVTPKCSFNTSDILLKHGDVILKSGTASYPSNIYPLDIKCTYDKTAVKVDLLGATSVAGKTRNYTPCGSGGSCRLTFDTDGMVDRYNETLTVNKNTTKTLKLKSAYIPNEKPVAGKFEGSAILRITLP